MKSASDIANFFIDIAIKVPDIDLMTNLRLNKLLYFAQGEYLAKFNKPLFEEDFQAWRLGPVIKSIYDEYKVCGRQAISYVNDSFNDGAFTAEEVDLLTDVLISYGKYSAQGLVNLTHEKGSPWDISYKNGENSIIPKSKITEYFKHNHKKPILGDIEVIEILPSDWYCEEDDEYSNKLL